MSLQQNVKRQVLRKTQPKVTTTTTTTNPQKMVRHDEKKPAPILKKISSFDTVEYAPDSNGCVDYQSPLRQDGLIMDPPTPLFFSFTYGLYNDSISNRSKLGNGIGLLDEESSSNCSSCTVEDPSPPPRNILKKRVTFAVPEAVPFTMKKVPSAPNLSALNNVKSKKISCPSPSPKVAPPSSNYSYTFSKKQGSPKSGRIAPDMETSEEPGVKKRCAWLTSQSDAAYVDYHDTEWGVPVHDDRKLFEILVFAGAQAELSWCGMLAKREHYRAAFCNFDPELVSKFDEEKITSLAADPEILQHEGKLRQIVDNAKCIVEIAQEFGSFDKFLWNFFGHKPIVNKFRTPQQVPIKSAKSDYLSRDLMKRGFRFVGPTIMYSFMQSAGMTNDHLASCFRHQECILESEKSSSSSSSETKKC